MKARLPRSLNQDREALATLRQNIVALTHPPRATSAYALAFLDPP
jgi:hypothetical protein